MRPAIELPAGDRVAVPTPKALYALAATVPLALVRLDVAPGDPERHGRAAGGGLGTDGDPAADSHSGVASMACRAGAATPVSEAD